MHAAVRAAKRVVAEACMYRHHPKPLRAQELVASGATGTPRCMRASFSVWLDRAYNVLGTQAMGAAAPWDVVSYPMSLARFLVGAPERI